MTREEAIEQIKWYFEEDDGISAEDITKEAVYMAIEALTYQSLSKPNNTCEVEVVRCKDCKIAQNNRYNSRIDGKCSVLCEHVTTEDGRYELKVFRNANDFCSFGERKEE